MYKIGHELPYISECIKVPYIVNEYNGHLFPYFLAADCIKYVMNLFTSNLGMDKYKALCYGRCSTFYIKEFTKVSFKSRLLKIQVHCFLFYIAQL